MRRLFFLALLLTCSLFVHPAHAQSRGSFEFIRDAEIESYLREISEPVFVAAGLPSSSVRIAIVRNSTLNAFVAGGMNIFLFTGLLQSTDTPEQLLGVIAHETGHISGGHLVRGSEAARNASNQAILGLLLGVVAGLASGDGRVATAAIAGSQGLVAKNFFSFSRAQESSADAAALKFLEQSQLSSKGLYEFLMKLKGQEYLPFERQSELVRTHPLTQDRLDAVKAFLEQSSYTNKKYPEKFYAMHERMKAKLLGFLLPETALLRYTDKDTRLNARYARAIALYRKSNLPRALTIMETLLAEEPDNPYFIELKAQMLFENGRIREAAPLYAKAVEQAPQSSLIRAAYGHALLELNTAKDLDLAIEQLERAHRLEPDLLYVWRLLAAAWGRKAEITGEEKYRGLTSYALAEDGVARQSKDAKAYAEQAIKWLPKGSAYWLRAQDIKLSLENDTKD
jgi:predicted Zn-dependent protease